MLLPLLVALALTPGDGLDLPGRLWVAGDVTFEAERPEGERARGGIDDLSLLARWEPHPHLALFGELRLEELTSVAEGQGTHPGSPEPVIERLFGEALVTPTLTLRFGKVFTPFGLWNVVHRAPLAWTIEEPAVADDVFPTHTTGLTLLHRGRWGAWSLDGALYGPTQDEIRIRSRTDELGWITGGRVAAGRHVGSVDVALGVNAAGFRDRAAGAPWTAATGLDLEIVAGRHEVTGELTFAIPTAGGRTLQGLYVQDAVPLPVGRELHGVVRLEQLQPAEGPSAVGGLVGLFWRPYRWLVLRADWLVASRSLERLVPGPRAALTILL